MKQMDPLVPVKYMATIYKIVIYTHTHTHIHIYTSFSNTAVYLNTVSSLSSGQYA